MSLMNVVRIAKLLALFKRSAAPKAKVPALTVVGPV